MTDIVERLRARDREWDRAMDANFTADDALLVQDAAEVIERLQHEKSQWQPIYQALDRDRARLRDEIERLRTALSDLLKYLDDHDCGTIPEGATADRARAAITNSSEAKDR